MFPHNEIAIRSAHNQTTYMLTSYKIHRFCIGLRTAAADNYKSSYMNRLILIGNGFDLAHGMKTGYNDFILSYIRNCFRTAVLKSEYEDLFWRIVIPRTASFHHNYEDKIINFIDHCYDNNELANLLFNASRILGKDRYHFIDPAIRIEPKCALFGRLVSKCSKINWVEIENEYYGNLKALLEEKNAEIKKNLDELNASMHYLIKCLSDYLNTLKPDKMDDRYKDIFNMRVFGYDTPTNINSSDIKQIMILNFNYTSTAEYYIQLPGTAAQNHTINYIHGQLNNPDNPIIFGFGDELDKDYVRMEDAKIKGFFQYIKSFWYFKTPNYHSLIRFIEQEDFQIFVMGHSCGLSDRTMLNMIFEHSNCKSIKIFYYDWETGNNYTELTEEISRHFKNKADMRRKIVPRSYSQAMPQVR